MEVMECVECRVCGEVVWSEEAFALTGVRPDEAMLRHTLATGHSDFIRKLVIRGGGK